MVYRFTTSKSILGRVNRLLDSSDWMNSGTIYIADGVQKIGLSHSTVRASTGGNDLDSADNCLVEVENHLVDIPCDLEILIKIECNGTRLAYSKDDSIVGMNTCDDYVWGKASGYGTYSNYYTIHDGKIRTSFETGKIKIFYRKLNIDTEGYTMIPDIAEYKEALVWQVFSNLLLEGYLPKNRTLTFQEAESRAEEKIRVARGRMKQLTKDERWALSEQLTTTNADTQESKINSDY